jgi:hypothetical protein
MSVNLINLKEFKMKKESFLTGIFSIMLIFVLALTACSNDAGGGGDAVVTLQTIPGIGAPVTGGTPVATVTSAQYTGTVTWAPATDTGKFAATTQYTATITLTPASGYTLTGVTANFFAVTGASSVSNAADSGVVTATFPQTGAAAVPEGTLTIYNDSGTLISYATRRDTNAAWTDTATIAPYSSAAKSLPVNNNLVQVTPQGGNVLADYQVTMTESGKEIVYDGNQVRAVLQNLPAPTAAQTARDLAIRNTYTASITKVSIAANNQTSERYTPITAGGQYTWPALVEGQAYTVIITIAGAAGNAPVPVQKTVTITASAAEITFDGVTISGNTSVTVQ